MLSKWLAFAIRLPAPPPHISVFRTGRKIMLSKAPSVRERLVDGFLIPLMRRPPRASPSARRRLDVGERRAPRASATPRQARRDCPGLHTQYSGPTSHHIVRMSQVRRRVSRGSQSTGQQTRESAGSECNQSTNSAQLSSNRSAVRVSVAAIPKCGVAR